MSDQSNSALAFLRSISRILSLNCGMTIQELTPCLHLVRSMLKLCLQCAACAPLRFDLQFADMRSPRANSRTDELVLVRITAPPCKVRCVARQHLIVALILPLRCGLLPKNKIKQSHVFRSSIVRQSRRSIFGGPSSHQEAPPFHLCVQTARA